MAYLKAREAIWRDEGREAREAFFDPCNFSVRMLARSLAALLRMPAQIGESGMDIVVSVRPRWSVVRGRLRPSQSWEWSPRCKFNFRATTQLHALTKKVQYA